MRSGVVLVVHGSYAGQMLEAARAVVGPLQVSVVEILPGTDRDEIRRRIDDAVRREEHGGGVLLLVDVCGSTPGNVCLEVMEVRPGTAVVTGLNLAMLMKVATADPKLDADQLAGELHRSALHSLQLGSDLLRSRSSA